MHMTDSLGRSWQLGTVQLDYSMPERFELTYTGADNQEHRPVMIHRAVFGSYERFIGIMIEHYAGELPLWLAPGAGDRAADLRSASTSTAPVREGRSARAGLRVELDERSESIGRKIREAELRKIPYMLIVGEREAAGGDGVGARARARATRAALSSTRSSQRAILGRVEASQILKAPRVDTA